VINLHPKNSESLSISLSLYLSLSFEYNCESMQTAAACQVLMVWRVWRSMSLRKRWSVSAKGAKPHPLLVHPSSLGPSASPMWNQTNRVLFTQWAWSFKSLRIWSAAMRVVYLMSSNQFKTQNANSGLYDCINIRCVDDGWLQSVRQRNHNKISSVLSNACCILLLVSNSWICWCKYASEGIFSIFQFNRNLHVYVQNTRCI
jgi:hypothetical protein